MAMIGSANTLATTDFGHGEMLLLGRKKYGADKGLLVLPGGKGIVSILPDEMPGVLYGIESPFDTAVRETHEETALKLPAYPVTYPLGNLIVSKEARYKDLITVPDEYSISLFRTRLLGPRAALAKNSNELDIEWHPTAELPYDEMQADMPTWMPHALELVDGELMQAFISYLDDEVAEQSVYLSKLGQRLQQVA